MVLAYTEASCPRLILFNINVSNLPMFKKGLATFKNERLSSFDIYFQEFNYLISADHIVDFFHVDTYCVVSLFFVSSNSAPSCWLIGYHVETTNARC